MRLRVATLGVLGLAIWGCGPPEIIPMTPPGISPTRVVTSDQAEALGEQGSKGTMQSPAPENPNNPGTAPGAGVSRPPVVNPPRKAPGP